MLRVTVLDPAQEEHAQMLAGLRRADIYPPREMDEAASQADIRRIFPTEHWEEYETLLEKKKAGGLTETEQARLDALRRKADIVMCRKAYAAVLLKRRGYHPPVSARTPLRAG